MELFAKLRFVAGGGMGLELGVGEANELGKLVADPDVDQAHPRRYYVYAHLDEKGNIFYIGKGKGCRAWNKDRHPIWHRYVDKHLDGNYEVKVLRDNMDEEEAFEVEAEWINAEERLINWENPHREIVFNEERWEREIANRNVYWAAVRADRAGDFERAAELYMRHIEGLDVYDFKERERGLVGELLAKEAAEIGHRGNIEALKGLVKCLFKLGRGAEAKAHVEAYFAKFRRDALLKGAAPLFKRVGLPAGSVSGRPETNNL